MQVASQQKQNLFPVNTAVVCLDGFIIWAMTITKSAFFITGTDTDVGKTYVASALLRHFAAQGLTCLGMKPVAAGCEWVDGELQSQDVLSLQAAGNVSAPLADVNPYALQPAIAPHLAAVEAGVHIDLTSIADAFMRLSNLAQVVVVEGAGGFLVPLNEKESMADLAYKLNLPVILVVAMRLGCINHALLTVQAIQARGLQLAGWVANTMQQEMSYLADNIETLKQHISAPLIATVRWQEPPVFDMALVQEADV